MKRISRWIGAGLCLAILLAAHTGSAEVKWAETSYDDIIKTAKAENKHVFIDFFTTWCGPCKQLDKVTYQDEKVVAFLNGMVSVKYDAEKGVGEELAKKYTILHYPTLILLGPDGQEIDRHIGYLDPEPFLQVMGDYTKGINTVAYYRDKVKKNPKDAESWKILGTKDADAGRSKMAIEDLNHFLELTPDVSGDDKAQVLYTLADANYQNGTYSDAARIFAQIAEEFAGTDWQDDATVRLARTYNKMGKKDECVETYLSYVNRHPEDPRAMNSFAWFSATNNVGHDEALPVALKMVELSGRNPGYLDTLAELYYAMGKYDKAIEVGKEAADKDPEDSYLTDQLMKFKKAKEEADGQAKR